jgi:hypothetical protein
MPTLGVYRDRCGGRAVAHLPNKGWRARDVVQILAVSSNSQALIEEDEITSGYDEDELECIVHGFLVKETLALPQQRPR